jgi:TRAP-type C4-dicarboxylate transport system permease small subunit
VRAEANDSPFVDQTDAGVRLSAPPATGPLARLERLVEWIALALFVAMMLVALFQVVARFAFIAAIWTEELARILFVASSLLGIAVCVRQREHIIVDYFVDQMPPQRQRVLLAVFDVAILCFLMVWLRGAIRLYALNGDSVYVTVPWIRVSYLFGVEILSILLMMLFVLADLAARWRAIAGKRPA